MFACPLLIRVQHIGSLNAVQTGATTQRLQHLRARSRFGFGILQPVKNRLVRCRLARLRQRRRSLTRRDQQQRAHHRQPYRSPRGLIGAARNRVFLGGRVHNFWNGLIITNRASGRIASRVGCSFCPSRKVATADELCRVRVSEPPLFRWKSRIKSCFYFYGLVRDPRPTQIALQVPTTQFYGFKC